MSGVAHALAKAGAVEEERNGCFRATVQYRGQDGRNAHQENLFNSRKGKHLEKFIAPAKHPEESYGM